MDKEKKLKIAVIAGASYALTYKEEHLRATEQEILQQVANRVREIIEKIDDKL